jgi:hypothetical protein
VVQGQLKQNVNETPISTNKLSMVVCTCHPNYVGGIGRKIMVQAGLGKINPKKENRSYLKNN